MTWVVVRKVFISSSIDRPLANNFLAIRQISEKSGYLSIELEINTLRTTTQVIKYRRITSYKTVNQQHDKCDVMYTSDSHLI